MAKSNKKLTAAERKELEVTIDFLEFDDMRVTVQNHAIRNQWKLKSGCRTPYELSGFYIGRGVTRFTFYELRGTLKQNTAILFELKEKYPEYKFYLESGNIHIYLRGTKP